VAIMPKPNKVKTKMFNKEIKNIQTIIANYPMLQSPIANIVADLINEQMTGRATVKEVRVAFKGLAESLIERISK
tara:strand:+ start:721 stop:945 length:225 start_codon:yes stop_codon:yes gene_type:complete